VSPILVRPVREQLEHDRVIRLLQQDLQKRKVEVGINPGAEQNAAVGSGTRKEYPDAVVYSLEKGKKVVAVVEVETGESVNHLEAMAQWAHLAKLRVPFHLYVPINSTDVARRLSHDYKIPVTEIWSYHQVGEQFKFTLIHPASGSRGSKGNTPPRTVSVATIRVALPPEPEPPAVDEPAARTEPGKSSKAGSAAAPRVVPVKDTGKPGIASPKPAAAAKAVAVPKVSPKAAAATPAADKASSIKASPAAPAAKGPGPGKAAPLKTTPGKVVPVKAAARPVAKVVAQPPSKQVAKPVAKAAGKVLAKAAAKASPTKTKVAAKVASARAPIRKAKTVAKSAPRPVGKRK
jgi:hypothetical protein